MHHVAVHHEEIAADGRLPVEHAVGAEAGEDLVVEGGLGRLGVQHRHVVISFSAVNTDPQVIMLSSYNVLSAAIGAIDS